MKGCGAASVGVALVYLAFVVMALSDGVGAGVEIPREVNLVSIAVILIGAILAGGAWTVDRSARQSAVRDIQPLVRVEVRGEVNAVLDERLAELAKAIAVEVAAVLEPGLKRIVDTIGARNVAGFREVVTRDLTDLVEGAIGRAHRAGMVNQAMMSSRTVRPIRSTTLSSADD